MTNKERLSRCIYCLLPAHGRIKQFRACNKCMDKALKDDPKMEVVRFENTKANKQS